MRLRAIGNVSYYSGLAFANKKRRECAPAERQQHKMPAWYLQPRQVNLFTAISIRSADWQKLENSYGRKYARTQQCRSSIPPSYWLLASYGNLLLASTRMYTFFAKRFQCKNNFVRELGNENLFTRKFILRNFCTRKFPDLRYAVSPPIVRPVALCIWLSANNVKAQYVREIEILYIYK